MSGLFNCELIKVRVTYRYSTQIRRHCYPIAIIPEMIYPVSVMIVAINKSIKSTDVQRVVLSLAPTPILNVVTGAQC